VITRPESSTIVYSDGSFQVRETLFVPIHEAGAIIMFEIHTERPLEIEVAFKADLQLEWPAELGLSSLQWDSSKDALLLAAQNRPLQGLFGLETNATTGDVALKPHVPATWDSFSISNLHVGSMTLAFRFRRDAKDIWLDVTRTGNGKCTLDFSPALSLRARVESATLNGRAVPFRIESNETDQHVSAHFEVPAGKSALHMRFSDDFELGVASQLPDAGSASRGLRILSSSWSPEGDSLELDVAGMPGNTYEFSLSNASEIVSVQGAELNKSHSRAPKLLVRFPAASDRVYVNRRIDVEFKAKASPRNRRPKN
jgi:hypothetical protein